MAKESNTPEKGSAGAKLVKKHKGPTAANSAGDTASTAPKLVKKHNRPAGSDSGPAERKKTVKKVVVKRKATSSSGSGKPASEQAQAERKSSTKQTASKHSAGKNSRQATSASSHKHSAAVKRVQQMSAEERQALIEKHRNYKPSVSFEITKPPRKRSSGPGGGAQGGPRGDNAGRGPRKNAGGRPGGPGQGGQNNSTQNSLANLNSLAAAKPADSGRPVNRSHDQKKSKARDKQDSRREDFEHFTNQMRRKKQASLTDAVPKEISIMESITVSDLAKKMNLKASDIIAKLMSLGTMVSINQAIDADTASIVASEYNCQVNVISLYEETLIESEDIASGEYVQRPPVVTIMGHVDHGKTTLLDALRKSEVAGSEFGGITQHIGAYQVHTEDGHHITFLDTPGHEAFSLMRARGAQVTDLIILIVAADDGVMPQTVEAIRHAKEAKVPIIVAITKMDTAGANPDRVKQQLSEHDLMPADWGGSTSYAEVSAFTKQGLPELLETIVLETEIMELKAPITGRAEGKVIESRVDQGRGIVATILIERGTLSIGDAYVAGIYSGRVRAMFNEYGERLEKATPATPVEIIGLSGTPLAGDPFQVTENEKIARVYGQKRQELKKQEANKGTKVTLDNLYQQIRDNEMQELKVIIKGDVFGSVEALQQSLEKLSTPDIRLTCIHAAAGAIIESDIALAAASSAIIIGFHVRPTAKAQLLAEQEKVDIRKYSIIYDVVDDIKTAMEGMLSPDTEEHNIGELEVRAIFKTSNVGIIAGCMVQKGSISRKNKVRVFRDNVEIHYGKLSSLKRFKDDAKEVKEGFECGLTIDSFENLQVGDKIEVIELREVAKKLDFNQDQK